MEYCTERNDRPLVTLMLLTYNQSEFVREALDGALSQEYSPLEIVISDDCSSDATFEIVSEVVNNYKGKHKILLNRNKENLGISLHVSEVIERTSGQLLFLAAGDDISVSNRVSSVVSEWLCSNNRNVAFFSNLERINHKGESLGLVFDTKPLFASTLLDLVAKKKCWTIGASFAADRKVFTSFGPLSGRILQEDGCYAFRALLLGDIKYIDKNLVKYRFHSASVSQHNSPKKRLKLQRSEYFMHLSNLNDARALGLNNVDVMKYLVATTRLAYLKHIAFKLPVLGLVYNVARIFLGKVRRLVKWKIRKQKY